MIEQLDYIFFVYGLSFILMATQCLVLRRRDKSLPWGLLAAFGIIHGINEWLDMLAMSMSDTSTFKIIRLVVMAISFIMLVEYGQRAFSQNGRVAARRWLTPLLISMAMHGILFRDINTINASCRYALGLPGALMAAVALWCMSRECKGGQRYGLILAAVSLLVYGFAAGIIVPKSAIFPALWLNHDSFLAMTSYPVQLIRAFCAFVAMTGFWVYGWQKVSSSGQIGFIRRWSLPVAVVLVVVLGWFVTDFRGNNTDADMRGRLVEQTTRIAAAVNPERVKTLSFTAADRNNPAFQRLCKQLRAYGRYVKSMGIWSVARSKRGYAFGPETYEENDPLASKPGVIYEHPPTELSLAFVNKKSVAVGPYTDEYGTFYAGFAPVFDPQTGKVLLVIGMDTMANDWKATVATSRLTSIIGTLVLVIVLLTGMSAIRWRSTLTAPRQSRLQHLEVAQVLVVGLALTVMLSLLSLESENRERKKIFREIVRMQTEKVSDGFNKIYSDVAALGRFFDGSQNVESNEFHIYAAPMVAKGGVEGCIWVQSVTSTQISGLEAQKKRDGINNFTIWQNDASGNSNPVSTRPKYYPVIYAEMPAKKSLLGFDEGSEPTRRTALEEAIHTGFPTASDSVIVTNETDRQRALLLFNPVFAKQEQAGVNKRLRGIAIGMVHYHSLMEYVTEGNQDTINMVQTHLVDIMSAGDPKLLAATGKNAVNSYTEVLDQSHLARYEFYDIFPIFMFGRAYAVVSHPTPAFFAAYPTRNYLVTGAAGILITLILSLLTGFIRNRQVFLEREVQEQTTELRRTEENLSTTLNSIGDAVIATDAHGFVTRMNPMAEELTGWTLSEANGRPISDVLNIVDARTREPAPIPVDQVISTGKVCHLADHTTLISRSGIEWQIADSAAPIRDDSGSIVGVVLVFSDMTEQYRIREALSESENRFRKLVENALFGVAVHDIVFDENGTPVNYVFLQVNPAFELQTGLHIADIQGKLITEVIPEIEEPPFLDIYSRVALSGEPIVFEHYIEPLHRYFNISAYQVGLGRFATVFDDITERKQADEALQNEKDNLTAIFASSPVGMLLLDEDTMIVNTNTVVANMVSRNLEEIIYKRGGGGLGCIHSYENEKGCGYADVCSECSLRHGIEHVLATGTAIHGAEIQAVLLIDGQEEHHWLRISAEPVIINGSKHVIVAMDDITEHKQAEVALRDSEATVRNITDSARDAIILMDSYGLITFWNPSAERIFGYCADEALGQNLHEFLVPVRYREAHNKAFPGFQRTGIGDAVGQTLELHAIRKDEVEITVSLSLSAVQKNGEWSAVGILRDITEQKQAEEELRQVNAEIDSVNRQLEEALLAAHIHAEEVEVAKERIEISAAEMEYQARHDMLTGLPNRLLFSEELDRVISNHSIDSSRCAVLFLDLDKFKMVNDTMGHKAGDALLVQTAARLSSCLRETDVLARMGGDEFTVLLRDIKSTDDTATVAQRLLKQISLPFEINGIKLVIGVSIGGSVYPDNATDAVGLLKTADAAMYKAKELGRNNCQLFSDEISQESLARVEIESDLRLALERDELKVYYQPIVDTKTMKIAGAEALLRWDHPEKGIISPGLFIPVAEETGLIIEIGKMVTETACKQCKSWQEMGYADFEMSVNVSPAQLGEIDIISEIHGALVDAGLNPCCLKLEVTETVLAKNDNDEVDILSILRSLGLVICLDDFGIGYSSLSRLNSLPIGHMKIDGYFIKNIANNRKDKAMTESIIVMAHNLGIKVTAEWIEDEEQMAVIRSLDCDYAQGYLVSPAMSPEKFGDFLQNWDNEHKIIDAA